MGLYIKGLDMPKSCGGCEFNYNLEGGSYEWWECVILHDDINQFDTRRTDCPLIEISTPHGRLIDEQKVLLTNLEIFMCDGSYKDALKLICEKLDNAPTILEAEEEE